MNIKLPYLNSSDNEDENAIDMTPMLDIVFIMLIFFIVTTSFVKEAGVEVNRPEAESTKIQNNNSIMVAITQDNRIWINRRQVDPRAVRRNVERLLFESPESGVVIQADEFSQTGLLVKVMDQIKLAGVENIAIAAAKGSQ
ncbi:biopolymer transporter ExbD [Oleiphilus sp. HI0009]|nr:MULTISPECIES: biopolymer transporter ExbD [unclassified Oleiphilus]KZX77571.1 biopolymer transporter ExbD [Oleiphilus sp. HI0009]KZX83764.1 biopolymer transporter ExbD [Oleiphilus sp. HI0009]KZY65986.1 biopolymer transporter ExbD [Oleiphilus sp. HI0066]KZY67957.1 biopolymer transporter ExbD [Oleiphilus sp. HI0067]KZY70198.1 biopolymer transporter ExbD [Oleiphilus sp. HI0066]